MNTRTGKILNLFKASFKGFSDYKIPKLSASLAYYTVFSLGPLLVVIIYICSLFFNKQTVVDSVNLQLQNFVGDDAAREIENIITHASITQRGTLAAIIGIVALLFGAGTVFGEIQDSINTIWDLKAKYKKGWLKLIKTRLLSFGLMGSLGFLLLVSLAATALIEILGDRLQNYFPDTLLAVFYILNLVISIGLVTLLFAIVYKVLPDAKISWRIVWPGAIVAAVLFLLGKFAISFYISKAHIGDTYGAAGSLIVLLVWIYYSSFILYFGAIFTRNYALSSSGTIMPSSHAVSIKKIETGNEPVG